MNRQAFIVLFIGSQMLMVVLLALILGAVSAPAPEPVTYEPREREPIVVQLEPTRDCSGETGVYGGMCRIGADLD